MCLAISSYRHFYFKIAQFFSTNHIGYSQIPKMNDNWPFIIVYIGMILVRTRTNFAIDWEWLVWDQPTAWSVTCSWSHNVICIRTITPIVASYCEVVSHHWCPSSSIAAATPWTAIKVFDETLPTVGLMGIYIHRLLIFEWVLLFRKLVWWVLIFIGYSHLSGLLSLWKVIWRVLIFIGYQGQRNCRGYGGYIYPP